MTKSYEFSWEDTGELKICVCFSLKKFEIAMHTMPLKREAASENKYIFLFKKKKVFQNLVGS